MRSRRGLVLGLAVATALLLSGCDVAGSLIDKTGIDLGLQKLTSELEQVPSVTQVTPTATLNGDYSYTVDLRVEVDELVEADVLSIVRSVEATFGEAPFTGRTSLAFGLTAEDGSAFGQQYPLSVQPIDVASEIQYWIALADAYGAPLTLELYQYAENYARAISAGEGPHDTDWDAVRAVPDTSIAHRTWYLAGLGAEGSLPTDAVLALRDLLDAVPISDDGDLSLVHYATDMISVVYFSPALENPELPTEAPTWPQALAAVQLIVESGFPLTVFTYYGYDNLTSTVHLGECGMEPDIAPADLALWEALAASTSDLPVGSGPGLCLNA